VEELWAEYDTDKDGFFSLEEYTNMICSEIECMNTASEIFG
jgi:Ca2+-binding EF-hand superfamily protein